MDTEAHLDLAQLLKERNEAIGKIEQRDQVIEQRDQVIEQRDQIIEQRESRIEELETRMAWLERQLFGHRSERVIRDLDERQLLLFESEEPPEPEKKEVAAHTRKKPKRDGKDKIAYSPDLPVERVEIDLPEEEKVCPETGVALVKIGEEVSRKLAIKPGAYFIKEIIRPKYAHPVQEENGIQVAELPDAILPRCRADESFLANLLVLKYVDHMPLYRIAEMYERGGVRISRQLLSQWVIALGKALEPLHKAMQRTILSSGNLFIDETPVALQAKVKTKTAYMWVISGGNGVDPPYRTYHFYTNRRHTNAEEILDGYCGVLHSDKYGAYERIAKRDEILWAPCWAHIRRKFFDASDHELRDWFLERIRKLFLLQREGWKLSPEERVKLRRSKEKPIINEILKKANYELIHGKLLPKSELRKAMGYLVSLSSHLKNYIDHPYARLDNNVAERAIRPLAIGRKNWLFMGSERGGHAAAVILSLVQTCRAMKIHPYDYLVDVMRRLPGHSNQRLNELLPEEWARSRS